MALRDSTLQCRGGSRPQRLSRLADGWGGGAFFLEKDEHADRHRHGHKFGARDGDPHRVVSRNGGNHEAEEDGEHHGAQKREHRRRGAFKNGLHIVDDDDADGGEGERGVVEAHNARSYGDHLVVNLHIEPQYRLGEQLGNEGQNARHNDGGDKRYF